MKEPRFGKVQLQIMKVLWERGQATARDITDALNNTAPIAHSTVQTLLRKLEDKGAVTHDAQDRTFVFRALVRPESFVQRATRDFVERVFSGSAAGLLSHLLKNERLTQSEIAAMRKLIDEHSESAPTRKREKS
ncbi:MAG: BlaI/MecI/CopY family transcriptional regulator [Candidatus Hydrogenedentes bacterium]|nr:BlaI/MecI/CopY family transcriptional regulator [Candidatus Hydrogenedentota bacterium]